MKVKFNPLFRALMIFLLITFALSLWAEAQTVTNKTSSATNQPSALVKGFETLGGHYLTFGLDRVEPLRPFGFLGEPLWKYLASLIYILLAFYIAKLIDLITGVWLKKFAAKT